MSTHRDNELIEVVAGVTELVARAMILRQDEFSLSVADAGETLHVTMTANVGDAKRLVGKSGMHLVALREISRLACWGQLLFRQVEFCQVQSGPEPEVQYERFRLRNFDEDAVREIVSSIVSVVFPGTEIQVEFRQRDRESDWMVVDLRGGALCRYGAQKRIVGAEPVIQRAVLGYRNSIRKEALCQCHGRRFQGF